MKCHFDDFIYGSIDGAVTTFAIVAGVMGASLSSWMNPEESERVTVKS